MKKLLIITTMFLMSAVNAQGRKRPTYEFSIGPGVAAKTSTRFDNSYDKADKATNIQAIPFMSLKLGPISLNGGGIQLNLARVSFVSPYLSFSRDGERYYGDGMDRRKDSWFFGGGMRIAFFNIEYKKDVQSRSEGSIINLGVSKRFMFGKWMLNTGLGASYRSSSYNNYYYGVKSHEVTAQRELYQPKGSWAYKPNFMVNYSFNDSWNASFIMSHTILGNQVDNSPTTKKDTETAAILGVSYKVF